MDFEVGDSRGRILLLEGDATEEATLRRAGVKGATALIAVCGNDGTNAEIAVAVSNVTKDRATPLRAYIHVAERELKDLLQPLEHAHGDMLETELVNVYERGAEAMLDSPPAFSGEQSRHGALLVIGLGELGQCLVVKAARRWRGRTPLRVLLIDLEADVKVKALRARHPDLKDAWELVPLQVDIMSHTFESGDYLALVGDVTGLGPMYICIDDDSLALTTALTMRKTFDEVGVNGIPIKVRTSHGEAGLASLLHQRANVELRFPQVHAFGLLDETCTPARFTARPESDRH